MDQIDSASDVRFGYKAAVQVNTSSMAASGGKAEVKNAGNQDFKGPESAEPV